MLAYKMIKVTIFLDFQFTVTIFACFGLKVDLK